ncbi:Trigger factor [uncultured Paludibacter sp.]|uniref:Trigger factor n=1 Tax=uncultured Paludibacter sp. TaxID=497635 RepID=A0A653AJM4_9BACT|nr:Trigger factor [uncultured Paludibacter sp.]
MNIVRKDLDPTNAQITISIEKADYDEKVDKKLREYRKKANIPGFRPGNIPMGLMQKMYGKAIKAEEINNLIADGLYGYIRENNIPILGEPLPSEDQSQVDFETQDNVDIIFDLGIAPAFDVDFTAKDKVKYYNIAVNDEMIDNQIKSYTGRYGKYEQEETVEEKDVVKGELLEMADGKVNEEGLKVEDAVLTPFYMKNEEQKALFAGAKKGDKIVFNPKKAFENETEISSLLKISKDQAKTMDSDFQMEIQGITRYHESEVNQELFDKVFGEGVVTSEEEFRNKVKENIQETLKADSDYKFSIDARKMAEEKYKDLSFPDKFLKRWLMTQDKMTEEKLNEDYPKMISDVTWHLAKEKMAEKYEIKVEAADIEEYARKVARAQFAQYGMVGLEDSIIDNYAKDMMKKEETVRNFADRTLEDKVLEALKANVKLEETEITIEDFNKLFEIEK